MLDISGSLLDPSPLHFEYSLSSFFLLPFLHPVYYEKSPKLETPHNFWWLRSTLHPPPPHWIWIKFRMRLTWWISSSLPSPEPRLIWWWGKVLHQWKTIRNSKCKFWWFLQTVTWVPLSPLHWDALLFNLFQIGNDVILASPQFDNYRSCLSEKCDIGCNYSSPKIFATKISQICEWCIRRDLSVWFAELIDEVTDEPEVS